MSKEKWLASFLAISIMVLGGCASNKTAMTKEEFIQAMSQTNAEVDALLNKGESDEAVTVLADLAKRNPDRKEPWGRMAKIQFDSGNYAHAIVSAEEVLQRDNTDRTAKSIRAVAGLRVASQSLTDLRNDVELKGNARADAASLAAVMREILGARVLVNPTKEPTTGAGSSRIKSPPPTPPVAKPVEQPAQGNDPFVHFVK